MEVSREKRCATSTKCIKLHFGSLSGSLWKVSLSICDGSTASVLLPWDTSIHFIQFWHPDLLLWHTEIPHSPSQLPFYVPLPRQWICFPPILLPNVSIFAGSSGTSCTSSYLQDECHARTAASGSPWASGVRELTESNCQDGKLKTPKRHESHQFINHINQPFVKAKSFKDFLVSHPPGVMIPVMIQFEFDEDLCKCWFNHPTSCALMFYSFFFWYLLGGWRRVAISYGLDLNEVPSRLQRSRDPNHSPRRQGPEVKAPW